MASLQGISYKTVKGGPMIEASSALVTATTDVAQDIHGVPSKRQVIVLSSEQWQRTCDTLEADLHWTIRRANLLVEGIEFTRNNIGKVLHVGELQLLITDVNGSCSKTDNSCVDVETKAKTELSSTIACQVLIDANINISDQVSLSKNI